MIGILISLIVGERKIKVTPEDKTAFLNIVRQNNIPIYKEKNTVDFTEYRASPKNAKNIKLFCEENGIEIELSHLLGLNGLLYRYRKRYGVFIGVFILLLTSFLSGFFIWDFEIVGNETVPDSVIINELAELGCCSGAYIPSLNFEMIANDFLLESDDIAWISVNMKSSLAVVEVLERKKADKITETEDGMYANLIASEDAEIILPEVSKGRSTVSVGSIVRKGDLLATGIMSVKDSSVRYEYATGEVLGKVYREIKTEIPYSNEKKVYSGEKTILKNVKIFGKSKNLFKKSSINYAKYDKIEEEKQLSFFDTVKVPIWIKTETYSEYTYEPYLLTESEAEAMAESEYKAELDAMLEEGEIVSLEKKTESDEESFRITAKIYLVKNIAVLSEFKLSE